jgi:hypothetical protein
MTFVSFLPSYIHWHYTTAITQFFSIWKNYIWFFYHFFSIVELARTLFLPWRRLSEEKKATSLEELGEKIVVNILMRVIGALVRFVMIVLGVLFLLITGVLGSILFVVWVLLPVLVILLPLMGFGFIFGIYEL